MYIGSKTLMQVAAGTIQFTKEGHTILRPTNSRKGMRGDIACRNHRCASMGGLGSMKALA
jgi:hypothetical protein